MTVIFAILPVVGSGLVWGPGAAALAMDGRYGAAIGLAIWGIVVVGNVDNVIRPIVFRRWAQIHPFVTVIGAFMGLRYFGLLGTADRPAGDLVLLRADPDVSRGVPGGRGRRGVGGAAGGGAAEADAGGGDAGAASLTRILVESSGLHCGEAG